MDSLSERKYLINLSMRFRRTPAAAVHTRFPLRRRILHALAVLLLASPALADDQPAGQSNFIMRNDSPFAAIIGAAAVIYSTAVLPYALSFAAGAMIFVVVEDVIPESHRHGSVDLATSGVMVGFAAMMVLDVALG